MIHALLAACIASAAQSTCQTRPLTPGTYKIIAADTRHRTTYTATASNASSAEHEAVLEPYIGDAACSHTATVKGRFALFPGGSHPVNGGLLGDALCVKVYKGAVSIEIAPSDVKSEITWKSETESLHSLAADCSVKATRLHCGATTLHTGTYRIQSATTDDVQVGMGFVGGSHRPDADGKITTHVDLSKTAGDVHLYMSNASCGQIDPKMKMHIPLMDQTFHDGGQMSTNTVINTGSTLCVSVLGTITFFAP